MENKARFDLNKALQDWKAELATQPGVSAENIRELEMHLLESFHAFRKNGCADEEAFSKATQKLGSVQHLGAEFAKENMLKVWRDRVFWITIFPFFLTLIYLVTDQLFENLAHIVNAALGLSHSSIVLAAFLGAFPALLVAIAMATGIAKVIFRRLHWIFSDRWRFAATGLIAILGAVFVAANNPNPTFRTSLPALGILVFGYLVFAVFVWPRELAIALPPNRFGIAQGCNSTVLWRERLFWAVLGNFAINVWTLVPVMGYHEIIRLKGEKALGHLWFPLAYLSVWLLPMAVVGLVLASAHLSALARWLHTRLRVSLFAGALFLIWVGQVLWIWHRGVRPDFDSAADWNLAMQRTLLGGAILVAGLIAITLCAMPSRTGRQQEDVLQSA